MTLAAPGLLAPDSDAAHALRVSGLDVAYRVRGVDRLTLRAISFDIGPRESFGLVGESGCGKSTTVQAITRYLPRNGHVTGGGIEVGGKDLMSMGPEALRRLRSKTVS
ncbi:MAG: ATP-binding cassette domain-containing protein, partial [Actinomycetota bacterium]|nr:ATP-binding cassette domain-containing protein [Actinomycetota bacterium]